MDKDKQKEITSFIPKELADPRIHTISLEPLKVMLKQKESEYQNTIMELKDRIKELEDAIISKNKSLESINYLMTFWETLSFYCVKGLRDINIIACAEKIKRGNCMGCVERNNILEKLEAKPR